MRAKPYLLRRNFLLVVRESEPRLQRVLEVAPVELALREQVEVPGLGPAPGVRERLLGARVDVRRDQ